MAILRFTFILIIYGHSHNKKRPLKKDPPTVSLLLQDQGGRSYFLRPGAGGKRQSFVHAIVTNDPGETLRIVTVFIWVSSLYQNLSAKCLQKVYFGPKVTTSTNHENGRYREVEASLA